MRISLIFLGGSIIVVGIATFLGFSGVKEYKRVSAIDREIASMKAEVERLERHNADLEDRISYFSSDAYRERVAKERLGYRRSDEKVVLVTQNNDATSLSDGASKESRGDFFDDDSNDVVSRENTTYGWIERLLNGKNKNEE